MRSQRVVGMIVVAAIAVGAAAWFFVRREDAGETVPVRIATLPAEAEAGREPYVRFCGECHGPNGGGGAKGPPLIHRYYEPGHHGDESFYAAISEGARQHHWRFGDMKPVEGVTPEQAGSIVLFVRAVQRANGIR